MRDEALRAHRRPCRSGRRTPRSGGPRAPRRALLPCSTSSRTRRPDGDQHVAIGGELRAVRHRSVTGDDDRPRISARQHRLERGDQARQRAAAGGSMNGYPPRSKTSPMCTTFASSHHSDAVAVRVRRRRRAAARKPVAVQVQGQRVVERDDGQRDRRRGRHLERRTSRRPAARTCARARCRARRSALPDSPSCSLPPVWSGCQCVLTTKRTGPGASRATASSSCGAAAPPCRCRPAPSPSGPFQRRRCTPAPLSRCRPGTQRWTSISARAPRRPGRALLGAVPTHRARASQAQGHRRCIRRGMG